MHGECNSPSCVSDPTWSCF